MIKECDNCGGEKIGKGPLCCQCYRDSVARTIEISCRYCGKMFIPVPIDKIYCGNKCRLESMANHKEKRIEIGLMKRLKGKQCQFCGISFQPKEWHQTFCSSECKKRKREETYKGDNARRKILARKVAIPKGNRICHECGKKFEPIYGDKSKIFCSTKCQKKNTRRNVEQRKRTRIRKQKGNPVYKHEIILRDGGKCQICGKKVLIIKKVPHPLSPTLDHIIPLSKGGIHDPKNIRLAHFICNIKKRDRQSESGDQLRLL